MKKRNIILICVSALLICAVIVGLAVPSVNDRLKKLVHWPVPTTYPYVFVHGLNGWGDSEGEQSVGYWGGTACDLMSELTALGYTCCAPSGNPAGSAWDRACELYAAITGTRVDYGKSHAEKYGHDRFGETYTEPLVAGWGEKDEDHNLRKINLVGHSFGGATVRLFSELMAAGKTEEQNASPDDCSPLFTGGKADWIFSVTALSAPHNGTTLLYALEQPASVIGNALSSLSNLANNVLSGLGFEGSLDLSSILKGVVSDDGLNWIKNVLKLDSLADLSKQSDSAYYDLTLHGADELNKTITTLPNSYYFSYAFDGTKDASSSIFGGLFGNKGRVGDSSAMKFLPLVPVATIIGAYDTNKVNDIPIDSEWLPNDGMVNTISQKAPFNELNADYTEGINYWELAKGTWNVMPVMRGDHGTPIGLMQSKDWTLGFYKEQLERIDNLSRYDTASWFQRREYKKAVEGS